MSNAAFFSCPQVFHDRIAMNVVSQGQRHRPGKGSALLFDLNGSKGFLTINAEQRLPYVYQKYTVSSQ